MRRNRVLFAPEAGGGGDGGAAGGAAAGGAGNGGGAGSRASEGAAAGHAGAGAGIDWRAGLAPEYRDHHQVKTAKDINDLVKWGVNAEKMVGADKLVLPGKDAKPEERDAALGTIYDRLGRPKEPVGENGYKFPEIKDRPYTEADKALQASFAPIAHKLGLSQSQMEGVAQFQIELAMGAVAAETKALGEAQAALQKEHGDKLPEFLDKANTALATVLNKAKIPIDQFRQMKLSDGSFMGDNPNMVRVWAAIGEAMGETSFNGDGGQRGADAFSSPAAAKAELDRLYANDFKDKKHPYLNKRDPQHKVWTKRVMDLTTLKNRSAAG